MSIFHSSTFWGDHFKNYQVGYFVLIQDEGDHWKTIAYIEEQC